VTAKNSRTETVGEDTRMGGDASNMDKIRDLLVGPQMRDYDRRVARVEERMERELATMRDDLKKSLALFDSFIRQEIEALSARLQTEQGERHGSVTDLGNQARALGQRLEQAAARFDERLAATQRELRQQLLEQQRTLADEIRDKSLEASQSLKREADDLRHQKTDRAALAALLAEVAMRLNDDFNLPGADDGNG
jgi:hypothetical protein